MVMLNSGGWDGSGQDLRQSRRRPVGKRPGRPASLSAVAAQRGASSTPCGRSTAAQKPYWLSEYGMGSAVDLARLDAPLRAIGKHHVRGRRHLSPVPRPVHGRLESLEHGRHVRQSRGLLPPVRGLDGRTAETGHQRHPGQSARHRPQRHRHAGPGPDRRGTDGQHLPRVEAGRGRRHVRRLRAVAMVPVRRAGAGLSRPQGQARSRAGQRRHARAGRLSRPGFKWSVRAA